ncbi:hypothetical protein ES703_13922 [subsurface metagenome]
MEAVKDPQTGLYLPRDAGKHLAIPHHSTDDWNFSADGMGGYQLDVVNYHSSPSAVTLHYPGTAYVVMLCKYTTVRCLPQGQIVGWFYIPLGKATSSRFNLLFRHQCPYTEEPFYQPKDCYAVKWSWDTPPVITCERHDGETGTTLYINDDTGQSQRTEPSWAEETWYKRRVTWWSSKDYQNDNAILIRLERWTGSAWAEYAGGSVWFDNTDQWKASGVNGCGIWLNGWTITDDTEIWKP